MLCSCSGGKKAITKLEDKQYQTSVYKDKFVGEDLCVVSSDIPLETFGNTESFQSVALFDITDKKVWLASDMHEKLFPASTTKVLTLYVALKYGNLADNVTVSSNATGVPSDSSVAGLLLGDSLTLKDLLYGMMLPSGNDAAVAVAEHIAGSTEEFVTLMNKEATLLGATNSNFVNPHGYHDEGHYTTAYDLYLIFNEAIKNETFCEIINSDKYTTNITDSNGSQRSVTWNQSNKYINGDTTVPEGLNVVGGKTGTTMKAGSCLTLYVKDSEEKSYIAIIMGAVTRDDLYVNMSKLLSAIEGL